MKNKEKHVHSEKYLQKRRKRALSKIRLLLVRVWLIKNWFTIFIILVAAVTVATLTGIIPEPIPFIGTLSDTIKDKFQAFLSISDGDYLSIFGSVSGAVSILFGLGYASNNIKWVSTSMINKKKLNKVLVKANMTMTERGTIASIEDRVGLDLDGNNKIGSEEQKNKPANSLIADIMDTFNELSTILAVNDEMLDDVIEENPDIHSDRRNKRALKREHDKDLKQNKKETTDDVEVVDRKPAAKYRPPGF